MSQEREERKRSGKGEATGEKRIGKDKREREGKEKKEGEDRNQFMHVKVIARHNSDSVYNDTK